MSLTVPVVEAKFTLLPELSHGRRGLSTGKYRPHIVIGPESQRVATHEGNRLTENYLGVMFVADRTQWNLEILPTSSWLSCIFPNTPMKRFSRE
jgi:hypothetical protein